MQTRTMLTMMLCIMLFSSTAFAAHPLITDDAGTQGKGKFQIELNGQYDHDKEEDSKQTFFRLRQRCLMEWLTPWILS